MKIYFVAFLFVVQTVASLPSGPLAASATTSSSSNSTVSCTVHRERELKSKSPLPGKLIPTCQPNGKYASLQCHGASTDAERMCQCWDSEGNIVRGPSKKTKACDCYLQRKQAAPSHSLTGTFIPECNDDGTFKKHQCMKSSGICWCANPTDGTRIGEKKKGLPASSCNATV